MDIDSLWYVSTIVFFVLAPLVWRPIISDCIGCHTIKTNLLKVCFVLVCRCVATVPDSNHYTDTHHPINIFIQCVYSYYKTQNIKKLFVSALDIWYVLIHRGHHNLMHIFYSWCLQLQKGSFPPRLRLWEYIYFLTYKSSTRETACSWLAYA